MTHRTRSVSSIALLLAALVLLCQAPAAHAELSPQQRAQAIFREGNRLFDKKDYDNALSMFREAYRIYPNPKIQLNIALTLEAQGKEAGAAGYLERFLLTVDEQAYPERVAAVRQKLTGLRQKLARVMITAPDSGRGAAVTLDGDPADPLPLRHALYHAPGTFTISVQKPGFQPVSRTVTVTAGQLRALEVDLIPLPQVPADPAAGDQPTPPATAPAGDKAVPPAALPPSSAKTSTDIPADTPVYKRWWFWTVIGVAVAGAATGAVVATQTGGSDRLPSGELGTRSW